MSLLPFFQWLAGTRLSIMMSDSRWGFAVVEMVHLLGLALLGGTMLVLNLRILGLRLRRRPVAEVVRGLFPYSRTGLGVLIVSGFLLVIDGPLRYYGNLAFRIKMVVLAVAIGFSCLQQRQIVRAGSAPVTWLGRLGAVVSLSLWLSVGLAGRAIGFL